MITPTTAFTKIAGMKKPLRVIQGGTSAGKTYSILQYLIILSLNESNKFLISIVAESIPVLKRGAYKDFQDIIIKMGLYDDSKHNKTDRTYQLNNCIFEFFSADDSTKLRGSRRDILFINEANNVTFEAFQELNVRTKLFTFLDYNPSAPFYAHTELIGNDGVDFLILTYKDNEYLDSKIINEIESWEEKAKTSEYWANRWKVMGLGQLGIQSGAIYSDWSEIDFLPDEAELLGSGLDYGFAGDPAAVVCVYKYNGEIIVDEVVYQKGLVNPDLAKLIKQTDAKNGIIYAESSEPKSNAELQYYGLKMIPVSKTKDSINYGIQLIQQQHFKVTARSTNLIKELQNYVWMKDKEGKPMNIPIDAYNHCFVGSTLVTTDKGDIPIKDIKVGDKAFTSDGYRSIIMVHNNGKQRVNKYRMYFDTGIVEISCTDNHKIKTSKGWKMIKELSAGNELYQHKNLITKPITCTKVNDISVKGVNDYIGSFMNTFLGKFQKVSTCITSMKSQLITELKTLNWLKEMNICQNTQKQDLKITQNGLIYFTPMELKLQKNGINHQKDLNGILNTVKKAGKIEKQQQKNAVYVVKNMKHHFPQEVNTAITTVRLKHLEIVESWMEQVYDITVEDKHEYFANGILVHNCLDALRYFFLMKFSKKSTHFSLKWKR